MLSSGIYIITELYVHTAFLYYRFDESRTPETWLANAGPLDRYSPSDVIMGRGISKGYVG